ncbi:hypothetical protein CTI12_AA348530 [Artemisia annua]|uniref:Uncharacterized protein n=1 Tax=Artemisia annua TaxID=35608 RepID=A0A2U1MRQ7_ARTAN|nr:hypothetical protein CTI12_AA348530 [Artemisia annua]
MALARPLVVNFYHGGNIRFIAYGLVQHAESTKTFTVVLRNEMYYLDFVSMIYQHVGVDRRNFKLKITQHFEDCGEPKSSPIISDETLDVMYFLAEKDENFCAHVHVEIEEIPRAYHGVV